MGRKRADQLRTQQHGDEAGGEMEDAGHDSSFDPLADTKTANTAADLPDVASGSRSSAHSDADSLGCPARRQLLVAALVGCVGAAVIKTARAQDDEPPGSDERPQKGDVLVFSEGDKTGKLITPDDLKLGDPPVHAWPMDPASKVVRKGSRLNELLLVRLNPAELDDDTRPRAADGIVAYSAVCSHAGCTVTGWTMQDGGDKDVFKCLCHNSEYDPRHSAQVVFGPAPRRLAALPLEIADRAIRVAAPFIGKVGVAPA
jgi:rieske iron-sulfur protein